MSHYHEILEKTLNSTIIPNKHPEDQFIKTNPIWYSKSKSGTEVCEKYEKNLIKYMTPSKDINSIESPFNCGIHTFKVLKDLNYFHPLNLPIPDTLIYGYGFEKSTFIYNDSKGNVQFLQKLNMKAFDLITKIFNKKRIINERVIAPIALGRTMNSEGNKVFMRVSEIKIDLKNIHKSDLAIQQYVLPKGNMCSKFRLVFRDECLRVFVINGRKRFDCNVYSGKIDKNEIDDHKNGLIAGSRSDCKFPTLKFELARKLTEKSKIFNRVSFSIPKDIKYETLKEFMNSVHPDDQLPELDSLFTDLFKICDKPINEELEILHEDNINSKIINKLRRMFCTYSKSSISSSITELKSPKTCEKLISLFNPLKEALNSIILRPQNLKISELICDFFEDSSKKLFFSQIKSCRCVKKLHVPLKTVINYHKNRNKFKCPGKFCDLNSSSVQLEVFAESFLVSKKKVYPKKCTILRGTIISDKFEATDNIQKLNPRLFESVQVCETCFQAYNERSKKKPEKVLPTKSTKKEEQDNQATNKSYQKPMNRQYSHLLELGKKLNKYSKQILSQKEISTIPTHQRKPERKFSLFDAKRNSIDKALQFDVFVVNPQF